MTDAAHMLTQWRESMTRGKDHDAWGQFVEASEEYYRLSRQLLKQLSPEMKLFNAEQKKSLEKVAACLRLRSRSLQNLQAEEISLDDIRQLCLVLENFLSEEAVDFPIKIKLPDEKFHTGSSLILEAEVSNANDDIKGGGTLLPRIPHEDDCRRLTIKIIKIGLKDPSEYINPFITVSVKDIDGNDFTKSQDTPTAKSKENRDVHFECDVELQTTIEKLPQGAAIFFEFKHFKPKKKRISMKCWTFMEMDELKNGPACLELYKKPADYCRKKLSLLTVKPLYLVVCLTIHDDA